MNLYEISNEVKQLESLSGEGLTEEQQLQFDQIKELLLAKIEDKASGIVHLTSKLKAEIDQVKAEIERLKSLKKYLEIKKKNLNDFLAFGLQNSGLDEIDTPTMKIKLGKLPDIITIENEDEIKEEFMVEQTKQKPDKRALLEEFKKTGIVPSGCKVETDRKKIIVK